MEQKMSDLKSALQKAIEKRANPLLTKTLDEWEQEENQIMNRQPKVAPFPVTNNVTRATFNQVRDNIGTTVHTVEALMQRGFKKSSVTSLITQMLRQSIIKKNAQGLLYTDLKEYTPIKGNKKPKKKVVIIKRRETSAGIAALNPDTAPVIKPPWTPAEVLDKLTVIQARALYDELMRIFTGG
jgi:hypothetical protein